MKKFSIVAIGIVFLLAGFYTPVFAGSDHGSSAEQAGAAKRDDLSALSVAFLDHIKEVYTTLAPADSSIPYNPNAVKFFYAGETIYFVGRIFLNIPGPYTVYTIVTNVGGNVLLVDSYGYTADTSDRYFWFSTNTLTIGTYNFSVLISTSNGLLLSPTAFTFVVQ